MEERIERAPLVSVLLHLGITSFGVNAWTGKNAGDRIINEHDEADDAGERDEELYLVHRAARDSSSTASASTRPPVRSSSRPPA